jgi:repressor LexA
MPDITDRQQAILDFVRERIATDGMPPTLAEIARAFGFRQARAAAKHLLALEARGYLTLLPGKARGIRLPATTQRMARDVHGWTSVAGGRMPGATNEALALPLLGRVAAGRPIGADAGAAADIEREVIVDPHLFHPRPHYLLRVRGDSMRDDGILDGDLIAVHRTPEARSGQTVVARLDGEITVKKLELTGTGVRLLPRNAEHAPIEVDPRTDDFALEGLYVGVLRGA